MAWVTHSEIAHGVSDNLFGTYQFKDIALPARGNTYWDGSTTHNPTIHKFNNKYYLYYMGNFGDGVNMKSSLNWTHRNNQRIGVAEATSLNGPWKRFDQPLLDVSDDSMAPDALAVNNPSIVQRPDGKILMVYKAIGKQKALPFGGPVVHLTALSESPTGPFVKNLKPIFTTEGSQFPAEDPYIWFQDDQYYAIVKDMNGSFTNSGRSLVLFESKNGLDWNLSASPLVSALKLRWEEGKCDSVSYLERPQLYIEQGIPLALFLAVSHTVNFNDTYNVHIPLKIK